MPRNSGKTAGTGHCAGQLPVGGPPWFAINLESRNAAKKNPRDESRSA